MLYIEKESRNRILCVIALKKEINRNKLRRQKSGLYAQGLMVLRKDLWYKCSLQVLMIIPHRVRKHPKLNTEAGGA